MHISLILVAVMTFVLNPSSGTVAIAVNFGYRRDRVKTTVLMVTAVAAFMHMVWERAVLAYAIIVPPVLVPVFWC